MCVLAAPVLCRNCCSQGEEQKKLDVISNDIFCNCLRNSGRTGVIASEEEATPVAVEETDSGNYIVVFDPLDGSSNIDAGEGARGRLVGWLGARSGYFRCCLSC